MDLKSTGEIQNSTIHNGINHYMLVGEDLLIEFTTMLSAAGLDSSTIPGFSELFRSKYCHPFAGLETQLNYELNFIVRYILLH